MAADAAARAPLLGREHRSGGAPDQHMAAQRRIGKRGDGMSESDADAWRAVRNVLCVRLDNLGDVLMTTPAMRALKAQQPGRRITLLTSRAAAHAAPFLPDVDEVICFDAPWVKHPAAPAPDACLDMRELVRSREFD